MADFKPSGIRVSSIVGTVVAPAEENRFNDEVKELRIAVNHGYKDKKTDEWKQTSTTWITYSAYGEFGQALGEFQKGDQVEISDAALETRTYEKKDGGEGIAITARYGNIDLVSRKETAGADGFVPAGGGF
jgi:single-stranded DNA-binding protein